MRKRAGRRSTTTLGTTCLEIQYHNSKRVPRPASYWRVGKEQYVEMSDYDTSGWRPQCVTCASNAAV